MNHPVLIIEDDAAIHNLIENYLKDDYEVLHAYSIEQAKTIIPGKEIKLILLDEQLPDGLGSTFCNELRYFQGHSQTPILMMTSNTQLNSKINAFDCGVDDYIVKPFEPLELKARIKRFLKKSQTKDSLQSNVKVKDIEINFAKGILKINAEGQKQEIDLTKTELKIIYLLASNFDQQVSRELIMQEAYSDKVVSERTIDQYMSKLRKKIKISNYAIKSIRGLGYKLTFK